MPQMSEDLISKITINRPGKYRFVLDKKGQELEIVGRFRVGGKEKKEWKVEVIHKAANTKSRTNIRGVVGGAGQAVVKGLIKVMPTALNTEAFLEEKIMLLSSQARAEAVPDLEIETDEVKCSHAATVGQIDKEQMFYLRSRGLEEKAAEKMLIEGFLNA